MEQNGHLLGLVDLTSLNLILPLPHGAGIQEYFAGYFYKVLHSCSVSYLGAPPAP